MFSDGDIFVALFLGFILGFFVTFAGDTLLSEHMSEYPGLSTHLSEQKDSCESRPNVISCEWDEDSASYIPEKTEAPR